MEPLRRELLDNDPVSKFKRNERLRKWLFVVFFFGFFGVAEFIRRRYPGVCSPESLNTGMVALGIVLLIFELILARCPKCGTLYNGKFPPQRCSHCRIPFHDKQTLQRMD
jgi:hypothetical protein